MSQPKALSKIMLKYQKNKASDPKNKKTQKLEKVQEYLMTCVDKMKNRQEKMMKKFNFGQENNKFVLYPQKNAFYMFNSKTEKVFFQARFQIVGTFSPKSKTWRWAWSNRFVPFDLKKTALKIKEFGETHQVDMLSQPKIKGEDMGHVFTALGMSLTNSSGYYIIPATKAYPQIYITLNALKKVDLPYPEVVSEVRKASRQNRDKYRKKLTQKKRTTKSLKNKNKNKKVSKKIAISYDKIKTLFAKRK